MKALALHLYQSLLMALPFSAIAMALTPIKDLLMAHGSFFTLLAVALIIDLVIGVIKYVKLHKFSFRKLLVGLIVKVSVAYGGTVLFLAFTTLEEGPIVDLFLLIAKFTILLYPAGSAFSNMFVITNGKFPPIGFMKKLEMFDQLSVPIVPTIEENIEKDGNAPKNK